MDEAAAEKAESVGVEKVEEMGVEGTEVEGRVGEETVEGAMVEVVMVAVGKVVVVMVEVEKAAAVMAAAEEVEEATAAAEKEAAEKAGVAMVEVVMEAEETEAAATEAAASVAAEKATAEKAVAEKAVERRMQASLHSPGYVHILHIPPSQLPRRPAEVRIQTRSRPGSAHSCRASSTGGSGWAVAVVRRTSLAARCHTQSGQRRRRGRVWCQLIPCRLFGHQGFHRQLGTTG